jgi:hypothetical protein
MAGCASFSYMLGVFGIFGRSQEMQRFDDALRAVGLHARTVPDAVKLTTLKQVKEVRDGAGADQRACVAAAELLGYCMLGPQKFAISNSRHQTEAVEARLVTAIENGHGLDARLVLLTLHAGLTHPSVVERYHLAVDG